MIRVGDRVRHVAGGQEGDVLAIAGNEAAVLVGGGSGMWVHLLSHLTPITPEPAPAPLTGGRTHNPYDMTEEPGLAGEYRLIQKNPPPAPLTGAQVAQVLEVIAQEWAKQRFSYETLLARAQAERERDNAR